MYFYDAFFEKNHLNPSDYVLPKVSDFSLVFLGPEVNMGIVSCKTFSKGQVLTQIFGEVSEQILQHSLQVGPNQHLHDPYFSGYMLHSCDPNAQLDPKTRLITAVKDIQPFELITLDYDHTEDVLFRSFACCCGAKQCRGFIKGRLAAKENAE